jgi:hypothetical protein
MLPQFSNHSFSDPREKGLTFEPVSHQFNLSIRTLFSWQKKLTPTMGQTGNQG